VPLARLQMGFFGLNTDLLQQLTFYGSYHRNKWNQAIHFVFVPLILWSFAVWFCYTGPLFHVDLPSLAARILPDSIARSGSTTNPPPPPLGNSRSTKTPCSYSSYSSPCRRP